jgi:uncharacterized protein
MTAENAVSESSAADAGPRFARNGTVSYMQIPAVDVDASGRFYSAAFGWSVRPDGNSAHRSFGDASGEFIGAFVTDRAISREPGVLPYIYVTGIDAAVERIRSSGGELVREPYAEGDLWVATFRDPAGNVIGIWQMGPREQ